MGKLDEPAARAALKAVKEPDLGRDLPSLNMVRSVQIAGDAYAVAIELPTPAYLHKPALEKAIGEALRAADPAAQVSVSFTANVVKRSARPDQGRLPGVKNIIAVAAGKGGVGKSTVASNLALALR